MSEIQESLTVLCPFDQVPQAAVAYITSLPKENGTPVVALRVPVGEFIVERRADLILSHARSYPGYAVMDIEWRPHDGGRYPVFRGTLSAEEESGNFCRLDLDAAYVRPLYLAGSAFDGVVGHHIGLAATHQLLEEIKLGFELAFQTGASIA